MFHCHNGIHEDRLMLRAFHMVEADKGLTAKTVQPTFSIAVTQGELCCQLRGLAVAGAVAAVVAVAVAVAIAVAVAVNQLWIAVHVGMGWHWLLCIETAPACRNWHDRQ